MKIIAIFTLVFILFCRNRHHLLWVWVVASPIFTNVIRIYQDNPFFGHMRIVDYVGYASAPGKQIIWLLDFDQIVFLLLTLAAIGKSQRLAHPAARRLQIALTLFTVAVFLAALLSSNILNALRKATQTFGLCYIAFIIGRAYLVDQRVWHQFVNAVLALGVLLGCICVVEYHRFAEQLMARYDDYHRISGPFQFWETLGMAVSLVAFVLWFKWATYAGGMSRWKAHLTKTSYYVLGLLLVWCIYRTQTRTIMLAFAVGCAVVLFYACGEIMSKTLVRGLILTLLLAGIYVQLAPELLQNTAFYRQTLNRRTTKEGREETYIAATRMFLSNPLLGIGLKNFEPEVKNYLSANEVVFTSLDHTSCHSSYLVIAAECGLLGLIPFACVLWYAFRTCKSYCDHSTLLEDKAWGVAMLGMTANYFCCGTFFDPYFDPTMQNKLFYMCLGCTAARLDKLVKLVSF